MKWTKESSTGVDESGKIQQIDWKAKTVWICTTEGSSGKAKIELSQ